MWKDYSLRYIKNNKATSISLMIAALVSSLFLSLVTCIFYNMWVDDINRIKLKEGDWQAKITSEISAKERDVINSMENVKSVRAVYTEQGLETHVYFYHLRSIYQDMPKVAKIIPVNLSDVQFHDTLLSEYFIYSPNDKHPPMLLAFYVFVMLITSFSLILIIRNAFFISMQSRLHQLGILQSIGATPRQIRTCLLQEALSLCAIPILIGISGGAGLCALIIRFTNKITGIYRGEQVVFVYHTDLFLVSFLIALFTVLSSAWLPAKSISKRSPLQVIKGDADTDGLRNVKSFRLISVLFGIEGELARKSLYSRRKALRTATLSLTLSFFALSIFLCFNTLSKISTKYTYFERYKDTWDIMVNIRNENIEKVEKLFDFDGMSEVKSGTVYQKAMSYTWLNEDMLSDEVMTSGGIASIAGSEVKEKDNKYLIKVPIVILDNVSFRKYSESLGVASQKLDDGMIAINRLWDSTKSDFRHKDYIPFIKKKDNMELSLFKDPDAQEKGVKVPLITLTGKLPLLKEEFENASLIQIISCDVWQQMLSNIPTETNDTYVNIQTKSDQSISSVQSELEKLLSGKNYSIKNRVEEERFNKEIRKGYNLFIGGLCTLLAIIGLSNVFSNTLGYIYQRKREFARYQSIGLSYQGIRKLLCMEALIIAGRPIIITLPLTTLFVIFATKTSYINLSEFMENLPLLPWFMFIVMIFISIALAYYIGGRRLVSKNLVEILRNDTLS